MNRPNRMIAFPTVLLLIVGLLAAQGCSLFAGSTQTVTIQATDSAAEITVDGMPVGKGAASVQLKRNRSHSIIARVGDRTGVSQISYSISTTGVLDIVGGFLFLIPFLGIIGPGFYTLDQDMVVVAVPSK
jgi:hypothetical protein